MKITVLAWTFVVLVVFAAERARAAKDSPAASGEYALCRTVGGSTDCMSFKPRCEGGVVRASAGKSRNCAEITDEQCSGLSGLIDVTYERARRLPAGQRELNPHYAMTCDGMALKSRNGAVIACNHGQARAALLILDAWEVADGICSR